MESGIELSRVLCLMNYCGRMTLEMRIVDTSWVRGASKHKCNGTLRYLLKVFNYSSLFLMLHD